MNPSSIMGLAIAVVMIYGTARLAPGESGIYFNLPGMLIVLVGTLAATLISYPMAEIRQAFRTAFVVLRHEVYEPEKEVDEIVKIATLQMQGKLQELEKELDNISNPFLRTGLQMVIDQVPAEDIVELLQWRIARLQAQETAIAQVFYSMARFAPAFGMFGTLMGLISMFANMRGNFSAANIGEGMAIALLATLYAVLLSNLFFRPIGLKLERRTEQRVYVMNMALEGILLMKEKRTASFIRHTLSSFLTQHKDELRDTSAKPRK